jgi:hypothetical protein
MDNAIKENSLLTFQGQVGQPGQYLKYKITAGTTTTTYELTQTVRYYEGKVVAVENLTTPGGTFVCSKWAYSFDSYNETRVGGNVLSSGETHEDVVMWTAHGIGVVKSVNTTSNGVSTTILSKIE